MNPRPDRFASFLPVIPAQAGIHPAVPTNPDSRLRGNDGWNASKSLQAVGHSSLVILSTFVHSSFDIPKPDLMPTHTIQLNRLLAHPANSNVMPEHLIEKLADHIAKTDRSPPLIVRPLPSHDGDDDGPTNGPVYQILDGHHRAEALKRLGMTSAECIVWQADDHEALLLLATLNRLQGQDDPKRRAALVSALADRHDIKTLAGLLPERPEQLKKLLEINTHTPTPRPPQPVEDMPIAVHFFLLPQQKKRLNDCLRTIGGPREQALMKLIDDHAWTRPPGQPEPNPGAA